MTSVKVFRIKGLMRHRLFTEKFTMEVPAIKKEHAIEYVYSVLGSRHKLTRKKIVITDVQEIEPEAATKPEVVELLKTNKIVVI
ncbi:MAG: 50S ribosomal protein L18a [Thermoprotei archaeon]|nr:50S ribosomal protein L18a [Thermoproteales archaeon]RLE75229.1 MAG: 50S ribosomal protein L18a [Thermoprotei archaeon]